MRRPRRLVVLFLLVGIALVAPLTRSHRIATQENLDKVKLGMSRAEVEAVLGRASEEWDPVEMTFLSPSAEPESQRASSPVVLYYADNGFWHIPRDKMVVELDQTGHVERANIKRAPPDTRSPWEKTCDQVDYITWKVVWHGTPQRVSGGIQ
jgi:SmpA / OmlA family